MNDNTILFLIMGGSLLFFAIYALRKKPEYIVNLAIRGVLGILVIHFVNTVLLSKGISPFVGINVVTTSVVTVLGLPGVGLLYALGVYW